MRLRNKGRQGRTVLSACGRLKLCRRWWHEPGAMSVVPVDEWIDPLLATVSVGVREMACRLNNDAGSFRRTAENLKRAALIEMSGEQVRLLVEEEGRRVMAAQDAGTLSPSFQATQCVVDPQAAVPATRVYHGVDGVMVPVVTEAEKIKRREAAVARRRETGRDFPPMPRRRKGSDKSFKEFKTVTFYDEAKGRWHERFSRKTRPQVGAFVRREGERLGFRHADEKIALVDGASWIREQLLERQTDFPLDGLGLDFWHLKENVCKCRLKVFGQDDPAGQQWQDGLIDAFRNQGYAAAWERLMQWRTTLRSAKQKEAADRLMNYVSERQEMIQYPEFTAKGWDIGSGPTESRCKTSTQRLKGRGRRWDAPNAEQVGTLTALQDSGLWRKYWTTLCPTTLSECQ